MDSCRKYWWRCDGPCRDKPPYFGYVKRAMNRPPQAADWWFAEHQVGVERRCELQRTCGGHYHLVKSPNLPNKAKSKDKSSDTSSDKPSDKPTTSNNKLKDKDTQ